jgi:hypothetical protein
VTKRKNGKAASDRPRFEVIGHETIVRRRDLDGDEVESRKAKLRSGYLEERQEKGTFKAFRDFAKPRVDAAFDPKEVDLDDESTTVSLDDGDDLEEARGLNDAIEYRKKLAGARDHRGQRAARGPLRRSRDERGTRHARDDRRRAAAEPAR